MRWLLAIITIYHELCALTDVSEASHPLRIGKIESGSLFGKLFGDSKIVAMMVNLTESASRYIHRNYTNEGKISTLPRKVEAVDAVLFLKQRLEEQGINTSGMTEEIAKASTKIAQQLTVLIGDEPKVVINDLTILINSATPAPAEIAGGAKALLNDANASDEQNKDK